MFERSILVLQGKNRDGVLCADKTAIPTSDIRSWIHDVRPEYCPGLTGFKPKTDGSLALRTNPALESRALHSRIEEAVRTATFVGWAGLRGGPETERNRMGRRLPNASYESGFDHPRIFLALDGSFPLMINEPHRGSDTRAARFVQAVEDAGCAFLEINPRLGIRGCGRAHLIVPADHAASLETIAEALEKGHQANTGQRISARVGSEFSTRALACAE